MNKRLNEFWNNNKFFIAFLTLLILIRVSIADQYHVPSGSMLPTIAIGDRIFVNKLAYHIKIPFTNTIVSQIDDPERGDIIVFENPRDGVVMVKRLIGLPGDTIEIIDGFIKINGQVLSKEGLNILDQLQELNSDKDIYAYTEKNGDHEYTVRRLPRRIFPSRNQYTVPDDQFFFMGDNRDNSNDSRVWGFVPRNLLKGRAIRVLYTLNFDGFSPKFDWDRIGQKLP